MKHHSIQARAQDPSFRVPIPVFSIRTENDFGVGDFMDIKKMVDWCALTGQKILQILPINDTTMTGTWVDSYPYKANSIFALHPMFLNLWEVGTLKDEKRRDYYYNIARDLNALPVIDYERVNAGKQEYLREIFAEQGSVTRQRKEYKEFVSRNEYWHPSCKSAIPNSDQALKSHPAARLPEYSN